MSNIISSIFGLTEIQIEASEKRINHVNIFNGYNSRKIEEICLGKTPKHAIPFLERIDFTSSYHYAIGFCRAIEEENDIFISPELKNIRELVLQIENIYCCLNHAERILFLINSTMLHVMALEIKELISEYMEELTGRRFYSSCNEIGAFRVSFTSGFISKTQKLLEVIEEKASSLYDLCETSDNVRSLLVDFAVLSDEALHKTTGLIAKYEAKTAYKRFFALFEEMAKSLEIIRDLLEQALTYKVPEEKLKYEVKEGLYKSSIETIRGVIYFSTKIDKKGEIVQLSLLTPSEYNLPILKNGLINLLPDYIDLAFESLFLSFMEIDK